MYQTEEIPGTDEDRRLANEAEKRYLERLNKKKEENKSPVSIAEVPQKRGRPKKEYKEKNIMKARSDLKKKGDKYTIDTEMKVSKSLDKKTKRALIKSIIEQLNNNFSDYEFFYEKKN